MTSGQTSLLSEAPGDFQAQKHLGPTRLSADDAKSLRWYLREPTIADPGTAPADSFGSQLERAESYGYGALPCRKCGGRWRTRRRTSDGTEYLTDWHEGTGYQPSPQHFAGKVTYAQALAQHRSRMKTEHGIVIVSQHGDEHTQAAIVEAFSQRGQLVMTEEQLRAAYPVVPEEFCRLCPNCKGIGIVPRRTSKTEEVTVWPSGSTVQTGTNEPHWHIDYAGLIDYQAVATRLLKVATISVTARAALGAYYGPDEVSRRAIRQFGRAVNLKLQDGGISALVAMGDGSVKRAYELFDHACSTWNQVGGAPLKAKT